MYRMYRNPMEDRAAVGAALLDEWMPGWAERIELEELDLGSPRRCVLGQLYGGYGRGLDLLRSGERFTAYPEWSRAHGFTANAVEGDTFAELTAAWRGEVAARVG